MNSVISYQHPKSEALYFSVNATSKPLLDKNCTLTNVLCLVQRGFSTIRTVIVFVLHSQFKHNTADEIEILITEGHKVLGNLQFANLLLFLKK